MMKRRKSMIKRRKEIGMEFICAEEKQWKEIKTIYMEAFPKRERKPYFALRHSVKTKKAVMEAVTDKDRIFELYLNVIEWGYGIYGAEAASQYFFKKPASDLSRQQAALLTARVPAPLFYAENPKSPRLRAKANIVLRRMRSAELPE